MFRGQVTDGQMFDAAMDGRRDRPRWGVDSEHGRLTDVMLCSPAHLSPVPCCSATVAALRRGFEHSPTRAVHQHGALQRALEGAGVRCHVVPAVPGLADLCFARDTTFMTPWGLLELRPAAAHRGPEIDQVVTTARGWGVPIVGHLDQGSAEGGDICIVRPGLVAIGCSGVRTDDAGARALASFFEQRGWRAIICPFDPHFLHLDTQFAMLDDTRALACVDVLDDEFIHIVERLGIELVPVSYKEAQTLAANVLSIGGGRVIAAAENERVNAALDALGYDIIAVELDQFTNCGGGVHCLTMPLARAPVAPRSGG